MPSRASALRHAVPSLASDTAWYSVAGAVGKALALLSVPFLTRALGPGDYGLVDLATATSGVLAVVAMFSGDIPAARVAARAAGASDRSRTYTEYVVAVAFLGVALAAIVIFFAQPVADVIWSSPGADGIVILSAVLIPVSSVRAALVTLHRLEGDSRRFAVLATVDIVGQLAFAVGLVAIGMGPMGAVTGFVAGSTLALIATTVSSRGLLAGSFDPRSAADLIVRGVPFLPAFVAFLAADLVARSLVSDRLGQAAVGEVGIAIRIASVLALLIAAFQLAWSPRAAAVTIDDETKQVFSRTLVTYSVIAGLTCIALASVGPEIISIVAGDRFDGGSAALPGLAVAAMLAGTHFILSIGSLAKGQTWMVAASALAGAAVQILVTAATVSQLGLWAVGFGAVAGRAASVGLLGQRVAPAFGRGLLTAMAVLVAVAASTLVAGLIAVEFSGLRPIRWLIAVSAGVAIALYAGRRLMPSTAGEPIERV